MTGGPISTIAAVVAVGIAAVIYDSGHPMAAMVVLSIFTIAYAIEADLARSRRKRRGPMGD